jgi:hypothetical protein
MPLPGRSGASVPSCGTGHSMILTAHAVPSAAMLPCLAALLTGWSVGGADISSRKASLRLDSDRAGLAAITVTLTATCDTFGRPADPLRPARHAPVRASAEPGAEVHRPALLHLPRRLHHLPVQLRPRRIAGTPRALPCAGEGPHAQDEPAWSTRTGKPALVVAPDAAATAGCQPAINSLAGGQGERP